MRMMGPECQLKIPLDRVQLACQQEKMQMDCNSVFPLDGRICMQAQTCIVHVVYSGYKLAHPD